MNTSHSMHQIKNDLLSGLTVSLALVPEAVAFSFVAGVEPMVGLYAAFLVGLITSILGRPGMISGATGAMAIVMVSLVSLHGVQYLFAAVVLAGMLQVLAGLFKLGKFIRIVPHPVMLGFVNGLAIVIFLAQLSQFKTTGSDGVVSWMQRDEMILMCSLVLLTMIIIHFLPRFTKAIPSSLAAILVVSGICIGFGLPTKNVGDIASIAGSLPLFSIPAVPFTWETIHIIFPFSIILAGVGLIESLLTLSVIDEMTRTRGKTSRECLAQGAANIVNGFFGAMGGCAMIGQSMINISSGGRTRLSGITAALSLLVFILAGSSLIEMIPLAALTGVMFMVVIGTFEWSSFRIMSRVPKSDAFVIILVSGVTVVTDLAVAVVVGVICSALVYAWKNSMHLHVSTEQEGDNKIYRLEGSIYFGSTQEFLDMFDVENDPKNITLCLQSSRVSDHSALEAISKIATRYKDEGKSFKVENLSQNCRHLVMKASDLYFVEHG